MQGVEKYEIVACGKINISILTCNYTSRGNGALPPNGGLGKSLTQPLRIR